MPGPDDIHVTPDTPFKDAPGTKTVNIDEWLNRGLHVSRAKEALERHAKVPQTPQEQQKAAMVQRELLERWERQKAERDREDRLDSGTRECAGCGNLERHYRGDYICFRCRDEMES